MQGHLPRFVDAVVSRDAQVVVELGSRGGVSTRAWLYGLSQTRGRLWTVDLDPAPLIRFDSSPWLGVDEPVWTHLVGNDLSPDVLDALPAVVDVLFIDTSHDHDQTLGELSTYVPRVRAGGVVLLHDTDLEHPDGVDDPEPYPVRRAVERYCSANGRPWTEHAGWYGLGEIPIY